MKGTAILEINRSGMYVRRNLQDTFHKLSSDFDYLRPFLEFGKILVENKHLGEQWQEISGPEEIIDKLFAEPSLDEQIDAIQQEIAQYERTLTGMSLYDGSRSSIENGELPRLNARLQELLTQQGKKKSLKEDVQELLHEIDVRVNGNIVRKVNPETEPETPTFQPIVVDVKEFEFWSGYIEKSLRFFKNNGRCRMSYKVSDTCYKYFKRLYENSFRLGYSEKLETWKRIAGEMYCRKQLRMDLHVSLEEIENGEAMIEQFER